MGFRLGEGQPIGVGELSVAAVAAVAAAAAATAVIIVVTVIGIPPGDNAAAFLGFFKVAAVGFRIFIDHQGLAVNFAVSGFYSDAEGVPGVGLQLAALLQALHGKASDAQNNVVAGEAGFHKFLVDAFGSLRGDAVTINDFDMGVEDFEAFCVDMAAKGVPEPGHCLGGDVYRVAAVTPDGQIAVVIQDFLAALGQEGVYEVPVVITV